MYGIAGRVWDATYPILPYLSIPTPSSPYSFSPPCSIFSTPSPVILELGSGQSLGSIHLIEELSKVSNTTTGKPIIYLTDLPEVLTLTRRSLDKHVPSIEEMVDVRVRPLAWDDKDAAKKIGDELSREGRGLTHILMIDLVYFPHLYPPLLRTLLELTRPSFTSSTNVLELILCYKTRSLEFEEPFFLAIGAYFQLERILSCSNDKAKRPRDDSSMDWSPHGKEDDTIIYICKRSSETLGEGWMIPTTDEEIMNGVGGTVAGWNWAGAALGGIEWDF